MDLRRQLHQLNDLRDGQHLVAPRGRRPDRALGCPRRAHGLREQNDHGRPPRLLGALKEALPVLAHPALLRSTLQRGLVALERAVRHPLDLGLDELEVALNREKRVWPVGALPEAHAILPVVHWRPHPRRTRSVQSAAQICTRRCQRRRATCPRQAHGASWPPQRGYECARRTAPRTHRPQNLQQGHCAHACGPKRPVQHTHRAKQGHQTSLRVPRRALVWSDVASSCDLLVWTWTRPTIHRRGERSTSGGRSGFTKISVTGAPVTGLYGRNCLYFYRSALSCLRRFQ